jgi:hypothetical protein
MAAQHNCNNIAECAEVVKPAGGTLALACLAYAADRECRH